MVSTTESIKRLRVAKEQTNNFEKKAGIQRTIELLKVKAYKENKEFNCGHKDCRLQFIKHTHSEDEIRELDESVKNMSPEDKATVRRIIEKSIN